MIIDVICVSDPCTLMNNIGNGTDDVIKYFYDTNTARCREFVYSGEGGNANRFDSLLECRKVCASDVAVVQPDSGDRCTLPAVSGTCTMNVERWFYDSSSDQCRTFVYGGCDGNRNRFMTQELCESACRGGATARPTESSVATTLLPRDRTRGSNIVS